MSFALITGASSGFGVEFAHILGSRGYSLLLVARREHLLASLRYKLHEKGLTNVVIFPCDLSLESERLRLVSYTSEKEMQIGVLINNAGLGYHGPFSSQTWEQEKEMINVNMTALVHLTRLFLDPMIERKCGYILNISSAAAFQAVVNKAVYAASKAFVLSFSEALNIELRDTGVTCCVANPGPSLTGFQSVSGHTPSLTYKIAGLSPTEVASQAIEALFKKQISITPGWGNWLMTRSSTWLPRSWSGLISKKLNG